MKRTKHQRPARQAAFGFLPETRPTPTSSLYFPPVPPERAAELFAKLRAQFSETTPAK